MVRVMGLLVALVPQFDSNGLRCFIQRYRLLQTPPGSEDLRLVTVAAAESALVAKLYADDFFFLYSASASSN